MCKYESVGVRGSFDSIGSMTVDHVLCLAFLGGIVRHRVGCAHVSVLYVPTEYIHNSPVYRDLPH